MNYSEQGRSVHDVSIEEASSLSFPPTFDQIPSGPPLIHQLEKLINQQSLSTPAEQEGIRILGLQAKEFETAREVILNLANYGLGDAIFQIPYGLALAREFPSKNIGILLPQAIANMDCFQKPKNLSIYTTIDDAYFNHHFYSHTFIIQLLKGPAEFDPKIKEKTATQIPRRLTHDSINKVNELLQSTKASYKWIIPIDTRFGEKHPLPYDTLATHFIESFHLDNISKLDLEFLLILKFLGAPMKASDILTPIFDQEKVKILRNKYIDGMFGKDRRYGYDLVVALDAGEYSQLIQGQTHLQSIKSPLPDTVEEAFKHLKMSKPDCRIAFVPGKKHQEYSTEIFDRIKRIFPSITSIPTDKTLDDMVGIFSASKVMFTADSITRWIAEALLRLQQYPYQPHPLPEQRLVTLHHGGRIPLEEYGPRAVKNTTIITQTPRDPMLIGTQQTPLEIPGSTIGKALVAALQY